MLKKFFSLLFLLLFSLQFIYAQLDEKPENIIILIGDGMGISQITAGMIAKGDDLNIFRLTTIGFMKTHSFDDLITDSAAAATAMACGVKTNNGALGVDSANNPVKSIMEIAKEKGMLTGLIATASITHATPAAFYAHQPKRKMNERIALDLLESDIDIAIGGGMRYLTNRIDGRDLVTEFRKKGYKVYDDSKSLKTRNKKKTLALIEEEHIDRKKHRGEFLSLSWEKAIRILLRNEDVGFFLMIEGSQIDWAGHANEDQYLIDEILDFDKVVGEIMDFLGHDKKTLILVLADHETGGLSIIGGDLKKQKMELNWASKKHTNQLIPVFAHGPGAELFKGVYDNTEIFDKLKILLEDY